jgi:hypothetical protein
VSLSVLSINTLLHCSNGQGDLDLGHSRAAAPLVPSLSLVVSDTTVLVFVPVHPTSGVSPRTLDTSLVLTTPQWRAFHEGYSGVLVALAC